MKSNTGPHNRPGRCRISQQVFFRPAFNCPFCSFLLPGSFITRLSRVLVREGRGEGKESLSIQRLQSFISNPETYLRSHSNPEYKQYLPETGDNPHPEERLAGRF